MTEFKEALIKFQGFDKTFDDNETFQLDSKTILTIRRALLIADRLKQEPSEAMVIEGEAENEESWSLKTAEMVFKAMRDQLIREIDNANQ